MSFLTYVGLNIGGRVRAYTAGLGVYQRSVSTWCTRLLSYNDTLARRGDSPDTYRVTQNVASRPSYHPLVFATGVPF